MFYSWSSRLPPGRGDQNCQGDLLKAPEFSHDSLSTICSLLFLGDRGHSVLFPKQLYIYNNLVKTHSF